MGAYDFMWNSIQAGQIDDLQEQVKELEKRIAILEGWIRYLAPAEMMSDKGYEVGDIEKAEEFSRARNYEYRQEIEFLERKSRSLKPGKFYPEAKDNDN